MVSRITIAHLTAEKLARVPWPDVPSGEQQLIAAYLDASCAAIDAAVDAKRRQLETLDSLRKETVTRAIIRGLEPSMRTKPSGVNWLGEIPAHWSSPCLKRLLREPLTYGLNEAAELEERDLPRYLRITDFDDNGNLREDTFRSLPHEIASEALLEPNDVLFARSGATVGKTFMFRNYDGEACFAGYLIRARTLLWKLDPLFLYLFTKSMAYESWKNLIFTQATIQNISAAKYNYLAIPLPPLDEQRAIVAHVEEKSAEFRSLTTCIASQITTLTAYRKSLIHECVTGQQRVTEEDVRCATHINSIFNGEHKT
jgi:restriction endonuclease S subunit